MIKKFLCLPLTLIFVLSIVGAASAAQRDRNHDGIPDRWEIKHKLSLKVNQASRDQDRDRLKNRAEFFAGTNPHRADSDNDGTDDAQENAGKILSYSNGELVVVLPSGKEISGAVDADTEIQCESEDSTTDPGAPATGSAAHSNGDNEGDDDMPPPGGSAGDGGPGHDGSHGNDDGQGDDQHPGDGSPDQHGTPCSESDLVAGTVVKSAEVKLTADGFVFREVELIK